MNLTSKEIAYVFRKALNKNNLLTDEDAAAVFYDLDFIENKIKHLKNTFPENSLHAIAIKANPLVENLKFIKKLKAGAEAASLPELHLALKAGFPASKIVFDSPAKTKSEINFALKKGININADSFEELEIIKKLMIKIKSKSKIGVRINSQSGTGTIKETSVAGEYSKFGIPIKEYRKNLQKYFLENNWLRGIHLHIGSQGVGLPMMLKGIKTVYDFTFETNKLLKRQYMQPINQFDIGGGLPVSYHKNKKGLPIEKYCKELRKKCPGLFDENLKLITEFGRYIYANSAWAVSKVEYVKKSKGVSTAVIHLGADMFLRKAYMPDKWHHEISVLDKYGKIKTGAKRKYVVAGPLCFAGDVIAKDIILPEIVKNDFIVIHDVGAYTVSMWSRYNSRQMPGVIGYSENGKKFTILKPRESVEKVINFWK